MRNQNITTYKPINETIAKHIDFYYEYELVNEEYYAFPSSKSVVFLLEKADIKYIKNKEFIKENKLSENHFYGLNKFTKPLFIKTEGTVKNDSISIKLKRTKNYEEKFLLTNRGFHWVNEFPFNR